MARRNSSRRKRSQSLPINRPDSAALPSLEVLGRTRWSPGYWRRHPALSAVLIGAFVLVLSWFAYVSYHNTSRIREHGIQTTATVVDIRETRNSKIASLTFTTPDGKPANGSISVPVGDSLPAIGKTLTVIYDPADPAGQTYDVNDQPTYQMAVIGSVAAFAITIGGWLYLRKTWRRWHRNAEAWLSGAAEV